MQLTLVGVVNPSQSNLLKINSIRYWSQPVALLNWSMLLIKGADSFEWLQRQLAQDITGIENEGKAVVRLDRVARVTYFGILFRKDDTFHLYLPTELVDNFRADFEKFVIMEDTQIESESKNSFSLVVGKSDNGIPVNFFGEQAFIVAKSETDETCEEYFDLAAIPVWNKNIKPDVLVNETRLNEVAINYNKGCFLGQETAAKIQTRRGANYFPVTLETKTKVECKEEDSIFADSQKIGSVDSVNELGDSYLITARLKRDYRILDASYTVQINEKNLSVNVHGAPYFNDLLNIEKAQTLYVQAIKDFEKNNEELALKKLKRVIEFDETFADAYEAIGVICSRSAQHQQTIDWMDKLLEKNPSSVMAHTNKSLALMNLGKIEEAEVEKSLATTKSFAMYGEEAKLKRELKLKEEKELADIARREKMFNQVLEIDNNDQIALFGIADINFKRKNYLDALAFVDKSIIVNPKHSQSFLLKGKCLENLGKTQEAIDVYKNGVKVAAAVGEMMPANEMQSRLNKLSILKD